MIRVVFVRLAVIMMLSSVLWFSAQHSFDAEKQSGFPHIAPRTGVESGPPFEVTAAIETSDLVAFFEAKDAEQRATQEAEQAAIEEAQRLAATRQAPRAAPASPGNQPTGCDSHIIPGWILQRESGCSYGAINPTGCGGSGCYGLYQIAGFHWNGGACSDLNWQSPADQDECASRLSSGGTNLAPWGA